MDRGAHLHGLTGSGQRAHGAVGLPVPAWGSWELQGSRGAAWARWRR